MATDTATPTYGDRDHHADVDERRDALSGADSILMQLHASDAPSCWPAMLSRVTETRGCIKAD